MKFTKEEAYKDLVAKLTAKGEKLNLSERSINEQLETLMPLIANEETELADFLEKVTPVFKTADANVRNDVSSGIAEFKKSYPQEKKTEPKKDVADKTDSNELLLQRLTELEDAIKANKAKETINALRSSFLAKAKEKGVKDDEWLDSYVGELAISEEFDVDARVESCLKLYNKSMAAINPNVTPDKGGSKTEEQGIKERIAAAAALAKSQRLID